MKKNRKLKFDFRKENRIKMSRYKMKKVDEKKIGRFCGTLVIRKPSNHKKNKS